MMPFVFRYVQEQTNAEGFATTNVIHVPQGLKMQHLLKIHRALQMITTQ
jgi:hypothetical protein